MHGNDCSFSMSHFFPKITASDRFQIMFAADRKSSMKIALIEILILAGYLMASPAEATIDSNALGESTSGRPTFPNAHEMDPNANSRPLFRMLAVNRHWLIHAHVSIMPTASKTVNETWVVSATQLVPFESPGKTPLRLEEPLLFEQESMRLKVPINASVTLILPRDSDDTSKGSHGYPNRHSQDQESLWAIALIRILNQQGQNMQDRQEQLITRNVVMFPQQIPIDDKQCIPSAQNYCPLFRKSPVATIYLNATSPFHVDLYRNKSVQTTASSVTFVVSLSLFAVLVVVLVLCLSYTRARIRRSESSFWVQRLATLFSNVKDTIKIRKSHGTPRILRYEYANPNEWDYQEERVEGSSNYSLYYSDCSSPPQQESLWLSAYPYYDYEDDTVEFPSEPIHSDTHLELSAPPFITRKFATTVWSFSALLDQNRNTVRHATVVENHHLGGDPSTRAKNLEQPPTAANATQQHTVGSSEIGNPKDDADHMTDVNKRRDESNDPLRVAADADTKVGVVNETFEMLHSNSIRNQNPVNDPSVMEEELYNPHADMRTGENMSQGYSTSTDLCESWNNHGEESSFYDPKNSDDQVCDKEASNATEYLDGNDDHHQPLHASQGLLKDVNPTIPSTNIPALHYTPSEDIVNRSRSLLEPVWLFHPSPSAMNDKNAIENKKPSRKRSNQASSTLDQGRGSSTTNPKTKRGSESTWKRNVKPKTD